MLVYPSDFFEDRTYKIDPKLCFVIMPYGEAWSKRIYRILVEILSSLGINCKRADDLYGKMILSDIWNQINEAAFIIADLTSNNPNVYYELGISHTLGKEIIPLLQIGNEIPFDQRPFRILFYEDNLDGYEILHLELPAWIASLSYGSNPQMMIKNNMIDSFNDWRLRGKRVQFVRENFSGLDLKKINLSNAFLTETDFSGSDLTSGVFTKANLIRVDLSHALLHDTDLHEANLSEANLEKTNFSGADLSNSIMLRANLNRAVFTGSDVRGLTIDYKTYQKFKSVFDDAINKSKIVVER